MAEPFDQLSLKEIVELISTWGEKQQFSLSRNRDRHTGPWKCDGCGTWASAVSSEVELFVMIAVRMLQEVLRLPDDLKVRGFGELAVFVPHRCESLRHQIDQGREKRT